MDQSIEVITSDILRVQTSTLSSTRPKGNNLIWLWVNSNFQKCPRCVFFILFYFESVPFSFCNWNLFGTWDWMMPSPPQLRSPRIFTSPPQSQAGVRAALAVPCSEWSKHSQLIEFHRGCELLSKQQPSPGLSYDSIWLEGLARDTFYTGTHTFIIDMHTHFH